MNITPKRAIFLGDDEDVVGTLVNRLFAKQNVDYSDIYETFKRSREQGTTSSDVSVTEGDQTLLLRDVSGHRGFSKSVLTGQTMMDVAVLILLDNNDCSLHDQYHKWIFYSLLMRATNIVVIGNLSELTDPDFISSSPLETDQPPVIHKYELNMTCLKNEIIQSLRRFIFSAAHHPPSYSALHKRPHIMSVQEVFQLSGNRDVLCGRVLRGTLKEGMTVYISPGGLAASNIIFEIRRHCMTEALPGDYMGFSISDKLHQKIKNGSLVTDSPKDYQHTKTFNASICLNRLVQQLSFLDRLKVKCAAGEFEVELQSIQYKIHNRHLRRVNQLGGPSTLKCGECAIITLKPILPIILLTYMQSELMGKLEYIRDEEVIGHGLITLVN